MNLPVEVRPMCKRIARWLCGVAMAVAAMAGVVPEAIAHGERNQEPFLRMRTAQWYDIKWSTSKIAVNDEIVVTGKFRLFQDWPTNLPKPETAFLGNGTPGPVLARMESYINGVPAIQSAKLELGRDYEFKTVFRGRIPGHHHVHPLVNVSGAGPILGPGSWLEITGSHDDFKAPLKTLTGETIENLETYGLTTVYTWHIIWVVVAAFWLLWWLRRPFLIPRFLALQKGYEEALVTTTDKKVAAALLVGTVLLVFAGYQWAEAKYPITVPLQAGRAKVEPLPIQEEPVNVKVLRANYDVPGRSMRIKMEVTNTGNKPVQVGEFTTANLRFVNRGVPAAMAAVDPSYPQDLVTKTGLKLDNNEPIRPGETRTLALDLTDSAWEVERLASLINDPDSRFGAMLFFYDADSKRHITVIAGPIVPTFVRS